MSEPSAAQPVLLAAVQDSPPSFNLPGALAALRDLAAKAAAKARALHATAPLLIVFPEAFLSAYPRGATFGAKIGSRTPEGRAWFERYHSSCVPVADGEGEVMAAIRSVARENNATLVVGVVERCDCPETGKRRSEYGSANPGGAGTLYCTSLTISPSGELLVAHRKLMPTGTERLVWGFGDGAGVRVVPTPAGRVGACICWENYAPLHRAALYSEGVELYCAPTADARDTWPPSMQHIAQEGRCFVVSVNQFSTRSHYPADFSSADPELKDAPPDQIVTKGGSCIVGPLGQFLAGPLWNEAGILTALVDKADIVRAKMDFDAMGHYGRPDVFGLRWDRRSKGQVEDL